MATETKNPGAGTPYGYQGLRYVLDSTHQTDPSILQALQSTGAMTPGQNTYTTSADGSNMTELGEAKYDWSKLPTTKYGSAGDVRSYDQPSGQGTGGFKLKDPNAWYDDPNYGPVTAKSNVIDPSSQRNIYDMIGPLYMSAVLGAAGAGAFGATQAGQGGALSLAKAGQGIAQSGGSGLGSTLGSVAGSATGVPGGSFIGKLLGGMAQSALTPIGQTQKTQQTQASTISPQQKLLLLMLMARAKGGK
jgi:hypothetical protein